MYVALALGDRHSPMMDIWGTVAATRGEAEALALRQGWDRDSFIVAEAWEY